MTRSSPTTSPHAAIYALLAALALVAAASAGCEEPAREGSARDGARCAAPQPRPDGVIVAGTGSGIAPLRTLARAYAARGVEGEIITPASIGTGGGLRALTAGAIDIAIAARPLTDAERARGLRAVALVNSPIVFATSAKNHGQITRAQLLAMYRGELSTWPDGARVTPLFREASDSSLAVIRGRDKELGEALTITSSHTSRGLVLHTDQQLRDALLEIDGAIGWIHLGMIRTESLALSSLRITRGGAEPALEQLAQPIYLVTRQDEAREEVLHFLNFARSPDALATLERYGYQAP